MTYDELVTNIRNYTEVNSNVFTASVINTFITMAENRMLRDIDLDYFKHGRRRPAVRLIPWCRTP